MNDYKKQVTLVKAIDDYCQEEFGHKGDYEDLQKIPLAYSIIDVEDENGKEREAETQIYFNRLTLTLHKFIDNELAKQVKFESLDKAIEFFTGLKFTNLIYL